RRRRRVTRPSFPAPRGRSVGRRLWYVGSSCLDRRTTQPMLPWLMAEIRRRGQRQEPGGALGSGVTAREVLLLLGSPTLRCVPAGPASPGRPAGTGCPASPAPAVFIFEHKAQHIVRFIHNSHDLTYFAYLIKAQPDNPDSPMTCHVFRATDPNQVPDVISSIRQVSKAALQEDARPSKDSEDAFYDSQKFEVLYCGKVTVAHKKAPSSLIDDCIEKFSLHDLDLPLCEGNAPASPLGSPFEELDSPNNTGGHAGMFTVGSQTSLANLASTRGSFPERILEDSGFDEQQEFRSRCSSVTAVMQRRVHDTNLKTQPRRRHASAPSHVQPSDSEKNRTMLFQVGRFEVNVISPDTKSVVLEKNFKDISSCSQGIKHVDHFGFICRESVEPGLNQYVCYVFQCASESLVDEVMLTLKQAFSTAAALQNAKTQIKLCEACPMHSLHKLCERIEGSTKLVIQRHLSSLTDNEQADIFERVQKMKPENDQEENELVILHLRQLCETKQKTHIHIGEAPSTVSNSAIPESTTSGGRFKLDILKNKAKKSLTSSLENIFSRVRLTTRCQQFSQISLTVKIYQTFSGFWLQSDKHLMKTSTVCSNESLNAVGAELTPRRISWRRRIFLQVASPMNKSPSKMQHPDSHDGSELLPLSPLAPPLEEDPLVVVLQNEDGPDKTGEKKNSEELQSLWRKAIHQQILLLRMEKENQKLEASRDELQSRKVKLDYDEVGTCHKDVINVWDKKLLNCRAKIRCDMEDIHSTLKEGVPKSRRGEIWQFLAVQHRVRHRLPNKQQPPDISYKELLKQLTAQQHAILVDLGRTFPTHPYFSAHLGAGQLSLFNLLKAYSLLDKEVGYCQGISFVAGVLLLHMSEEQAFEMLKFLMYDLGFRKQYRPDMMSLQIQMYQLSRLLHDYHRDLYNHLEENEISPSLYAAPWFLTLFASQFPLGFVARVFDIIFLQGTEVIFKVALSLLSSQETSIMGCDSFENIVDFLKTTVPDMTQPQMAKIITQVFEMDISKQLHAYEVEYHVLQDELQENVNPCDEGEPLEKLERVNSHLKRQNMDLLEKLQVAHAKIQSLESSLETILTRENKMKTAIQSLEQEKITYQKTLEQIVKYLPAEALSDCELLLKEVNYNPNNKIRSKP
uniref:TBC1 domain family member 4 n=1 Tax=Amazona collaria TaxID=241587 RepID=A0A8B9J1C1_9PSIT